MTEQDKAKELIMKHWPHILQDGDGYIEIVAKDVMDLMVEFAQLSTNQWISIEDRLPEEGVEVLVYLGDCYEATHLIDADTTEGPQWMCLGQSYITHWQPILPPKQ